MVAVRRKEVQLTHKDCVAGQFPRNAGSDQISSDVCLQNNTLLGSYHSKLVAGATCPLCCNQLERLKMAHAAMMAV